MQIIRHTVETTATKEAIWEIWEDVSSWNQWDHGIEYSSIQGPFATGTLGELKPVDAPLVKTCLTLVELKSRFIDEAKLFLGRIIMTHTISEADGKRIVTHQIEMKGPLAFLYAFVIGREMKKNLPKEMAKMIQLAEERS